MSSLRTRIAQLERAIGTDDEPRHIVVYGGPHYSESWVEHHGGIVDLHVATPDVDADPLDFLTDEQRALIRPGDHVVIFHTWVDGRGGRNPHLQMNLPPWKRRPWRLTGNHPRDWEWQDEWCVWRAPDDHELMTTVRDEPTCQD